MIYIQTNDSDYSVEDIISEEYLHVITDKKDEVLKLKKKCFWSIEITVSRFYLMPKVDEQMFITNS